MDANKREGEKPEVERFATNPFHPGTMPGTDLSLAFMDNPAGATEKSQGRIRIVELMGMGLLRATTAGKNGPGWRGCVDARQDSREGA